MEFEILDDERRRVPRDGAAFGAMHVRGPWVAGSYYGLPHSSAHARAGWFETGDVATIDADGFVKIVDRTKDVVRSGGEWISSIALENAAISHPAVLKAAVVACPDARWGERPLLVVVLRPGAAATEAELLAHLAGQVAKWWVPGEVVFALDLPHTATGKLQKNRIRELYVQSCDDKGGTALTPQPATLPSQRPSQGHER